MSLKVLQTYVNSPPVCNEAVWQIAAARHPIKTPCVVVFVALALPVRAYLLTPSYEKPSTPWNPSSAERLVTTGPLHPLPGYSSHNGPEIMQSIQQGH